MIRKYTLFIAFLSLVFLSSCDKDDNYQTRMEDERSNRSHYLEQNGIGKEDLLPEGIYFQDLIVPDITKAKKVEKGDEIVVYYTGYLLNGFVFDSNMLAGKFEPMTIRIQNEFSGQIIKQGAASGRVITGWPPALLKMYEGSKARIVVPSNMGYGAFGNGKIPGYTSLVFEIEVQEVRKPN